MIISIDPAWGKPWAIAVFTDGGRLEDVETCVELDPNAFRHFTGVSRVITEEPYLAPESKDQKHTRAKAYNYGTQGAFHTFRSLCYAVGMVHQFARELGARVVMVRPSDWKRFYRVTKTTAPAIRKQIRRQVAGFEGNEDMQDAVLIGRYWIEHVRVGR